MTKVNWETESELEKYSKNFTIQPRWNRRLKFRQNDVHHFAKNDVHHFANISVF